MSVQQLSITEIDLFIDCLVREGKTISHAYLELTHARNQRTHAPVDICRITELSLTQTLSRAIRCY